MPQYRTSYFMYSNYRQRYAQTWEMISAPVHVFVQARIFEIAGPICLCETVDKSIDGVILVFRRYLKSSRMLNFWKFFCSWHCVRRKSLAFGVARHDFFPRANCKGSSCFFIPSDEINCAIGSRIATLSTDRMTSTLRRCRTTLMLPNELSSEVVSLVVFARLLLFTTHDYLNYILIEKQMQNFARYVASTDHHNKIILDLQHQGKPKATPNVTHVEKYGSRHSLISKTIITHLKYAFRNSDQHEC